MNSSVDHKCQRCGSQYHGQICPFCTITGLDVNALLAAEGITLAGLAAPIEDASVDDVGQIMLVDVVSNRTYPVSAPVCRFGRDITNDIVLTGDKSLSRFHFQVTVLNEEFFVEDAGSRNGTFLNGAPVNAPKKILDGDIISAGMSRYRFVLSADGQSPIEQDNSQDRGTNNTAAANADPMGTTGDMSDLPRKFKELQEGLNLENNLRDPLARLYEEGQALMASKDNEDDQDYQFDNDAQGDFSPAAHMSPELAVIQPAAAETSNGHHDGTTNQAQAGNEVPIDELFQEQLRVMQAVESGQAANYEQSAQYQQNYREQPVMQQEQISLEYEQEQPAVHEQYGQSNPQKREWPTWCENFRFQELDDMEEQIEDLEDLLSAKKIELDELRQAVAGAEHIKNSLLATRDEELIQTCSQVFQLLGWQTSVNGTAANELVLSCENTAEAIVKIVCTTGQPKPQELGNLVGSLSAFWSEHGIEPKGVLLVSITADGPPEERPTLSSDYSDYASKKNVCLMSSLQLLSMYRAATLQGGDIESIKAAILGGSGQLSGYELASAATA